jgi:DNA-binding LacI/PurR family transcriptional regulator
LHGDSASLSPGKQENTQLFHQPLQGIISFCTIDDNSAMSAGDMTPPTVFLGLHGEDNFPCISGDTRLGLYKLTRHIIDAGHRQIEIWAEPSTNSAHVDHALQGYARAMHQAGMDAKYNTLQSCRQFFSSDLRTISAALKNLGETTCIICLTSDLAARACELADVLGMGVPGDLSVATLGHRMINSSSQDLKIIMGLRYNWEKICNLSIEMLEIQASKGEPAISQIKMEPFLVKDANTVAAPSHSAHINWKQVKKI